MAYATIPGSSISVPSSAIGVAGSGYTKIPSGSSFTPASIASLTLDLNADLVSGNDGDAIATWANQAPATGATNNFVQATAANKPLLKRNIVNGHSTLLFDGTNDVMTSGMVAATGAASMYVVFKPVTLPTAGNGQRVVSLLSATPAQFAFSINNVGGYQPYAFIAKNTASAVNGSGIANALSAASHSIGIRYNGGTNTLPASYSCSLDCISQIVVASGAIANGVTLATTSIGAYYQGGPFQPYAGHLARVLYFSEELSTANDTAVQAYICAQYGL